MILDKPKIEDPIIDDTYLLEGNADLNLFDFNDSMTSSIKANSKSTKSVISDLDAILSSANAVENIDNDTNVKKVKIKETKNSIVIESKTSTIVKKKKNSEDIPYKSVNLFGDDDDEK